MAGKTMDFTGGNCMQRHPDEFFAEKGTAQIQVRDAKAVCNGQLPGITICPKRKECLEYALENRERFGVWGGKSERERTRIIRMRKTRAENKVAGAIKGRMREAERKARLKVNAHFFVDRRPHDGHQAGNSREHTGQGQG